MLVDMTPDSLNWSDTMLKSLGIFLTLAALVALLSACSDTSPLPTEANPAPSPNDYDEATPADLTPRPSGPSAAPNTTTGPRATTSRAATTGANATTSPAATTGAGATPTANPTPDQVTGEAKGMLEVLEQSADAMRELKSVHFRLDNIVSFEMPGFPAISAPTFVEGDYQAPDRYRYYGSLGPMFGAAIVSNITVIGQRMYVDGAIVMGEEAYLYPRFSLDASGVGPLFPEGVDADPKLLEGVTMAVTELEGESVYHLIAPLSGEALRSALEDAYTNQSLSGAVPGGAALDAQSQAASMVLGAEGKTEIWIGVDDYLIRKSYTFLTQKFQDTSSGAEVVYVTDGATLFSHYNEVVNIQEP